MKRKIDNTETNSTPYTKSTLITQVIMTIVAVVFILPIFVVFNYSFKTKKELYLTNALTLPSSIQFENYKKAFEKLNLTTTFTNTFLYTAIAVIILAILCSATAWAIARSKGKFFKF